MSSNAVQKKRQRLENSETAKAGRALAHSRILAPFRSIGHVTSSTPFSLLSLGQTFQITTALDSTLQTYDVRKLNLLFVTSPPTPGKIHRVVAHQRDVYAAFEGPGVWIFRRGQKVGELQRPAAQWSIWKDLVIIGEWVVGAFAQGLVVWKRDTGDIWTEVAMQGGLGGALLAMCHPSTLLNKVCVARENGEIEIWNVKTNKHIYTILPPLPAAAKAISKVTTVVQSPLISVVAIGYSTGEVHLHDIVTDHPLFTLNVALARQKSIASHQKKVVSLSFCTDPFVGARKESATSEAGGRILAVGDDLGHVTLWNLEKRAVSAVMWNAHINEGVNVQWLQGQNVLVTSGSDNSMKAWIFDSPHNTLPRILNSRAGHCQSITTLAFDSPSTSHFLLSSSLDCTLRAHSLWSDSQTFEFSQGSGTKKAMRAAKFNPDLADQITNVRAGPITSICTSADDGSGSTGRQWENILTAHQGEPAARCWSTRNKRQGGLDLKTLDRKEAKVVAISACGTFGLVGSAGGSIDMYNLESGIHRRRFPAPLTQAQAKKVKRGEATGLLLSLGKGKHTKAITGLYTDSLNRTVISTSLDGSVKFWSFNNGTLVHELRLKGAGAITKAKLHRSSELLAVSSDDRCIRVLDIETKKIVRELWECGGNICDFTFSADARWIIAASMDSIIRIWDLPTGHIVDALRTSSIVTALAFAGTGEYVATAHVDSVGINIWTNRTLFRQVPTTRVTDADIVELSSPTASGLGGTGFMEGALVPGGSEEQSDGDIDMYVTRADPLSDTLLTLSTVPRTRWQTLVNLDLIRTRNKPREIPRVPDKAPFFLGSASLMPATSNASIIISANEEPSAGVVSRIRHADLLSNASNIDNPFTCQLKNQDYGGLVCTLKELPPSKADMEIRNLDNDEMVDFVEALTQTLEARRDFELVMAWMKVFLKCHGSEVTAAIGEKVDCSDTRTLRQALNKWRNSAKTEGERLSERVSYCRALVSFLRTSKQ